MAQNLIDRAIEFVSPIRAARRAQARAALDQFRSYEAAKVGRRTDGWIAAGSSANAEIGPASARIRNRARDLARNNPHGARAVQLISTAVVGTGIKPRLAPAPDPAEAEVLNRFGDWMGQSAADGRLDWCQQQKILIRSVAESGEALILWRPRPARFGLAAPIQCEVLEADYLDTTKTAAARNGDGRTIIQGVQFDSDGRREGYWLFSTHPGEVSPLSAGRFQSRFVEARLVDHVFDGLRPGQVRGVSWLAPIVLRLRDIDDYNDAEIVRKKIEACFSVFVTSGPNPTGPLSKSATDAKSRRTEQLAPGMFQYLQPGEEINFASPDASEGYAEFLSVQLHAVAMGLGATYELLTGDLDKASFIALRAGNLPWYAVVDQWQHLMMIPQACKPAWWRVDAAAKAASGRNSPTPPAEWGTPGRPWLDPREIRARIDEIRGGLTSLRQEIAAKGLDPDKILKEISQTNIQLDDLELTLDTDPRHSGRTGAGEAEAKTTTATD